MTTAITVPFHGSNLFVVEHNSQPFTPMKQIVEGMGLNWASQYTKLNSNPERWGVVKITIPTNGDMQQTICLPLRKLFGWLQTISPNKVKASIREKVIQYQNECDDVLWQYWTGRTVPQPLPQIECQAPKPNQSRRITLSQLQYEIAQIRGVPVEQVRIHYRELFNNPNWPETNDEFAVALSNAKLRTDLAELQKEQSVDVQALTQQASAAGLAVVPRRELESIYHHLQQQQTHIEQLNEITVKLGKQNALLLGRNIWR